MKSIRLAFCAFLCGGLLMNTNASAGGTASPGVSMLSGQWGGDRMVLTLDATGGRIEMDCASGTLRSPLKAAGNGRFESTGSFEQHAPGPQRADKASAAVNVRFVGELHDGALTLTILQPGTQAPQVFQLREGARVKLLRCL